MQINSINSNQSFGMALKISNRAEGVLAARIKSNADINSLNSLIVSQRNNRFTIEIGEEEGKLHAFILDGLKPKTYLTENFIEKNFKTPIAFIKRCCKAADKLNGDTYALVINHKLKNIFNQTKII